MILNISTIIIALLAFTISNLSIANTALNIPHVSQKAVDSYQYDYVYAGFNRAFAIAPGGAWAWKSDEVTEDVAANSALDACSQYTEQKCHLFSVNNKVVFDQKRWFESWGPYKTKQQALNATTGTKVGQKFYNLSFTNPDGRKKTIADYQGKVVFVHFWGCWCPPCRLEFGTLTDMYREIEKRYSEDIEMVVLQVREPIETARQWTEKHGFTELPLSDSGVISDEDVELTLADGTKILDRKLAKVFPSSYVLDKNGVVVFSHMGSVHDWTEYIPFIRDVVVRSKN